MPFWEAQNSLTASQWFLRATFTYLYLLILTKIMGQREIGKLGLFDFIISVTMGSVSAGVLSNSQTALRNILITVGTLALWQIVISYISLKSGKIRRVVEEEPIILVQNGQLLENAMKKTRVNIDDLMSLLRQKNYFNLHQIEFAVLEPNGKISVLPKSQNRPITPLDLNISTKYEGYPSMLIQDGNILTENLKLINLDEKWLMNQLQNNNISDAKEILVAMLDTRGQLYYSLKNSASEKTGAQGEDSKL